MSARGWRCGDRTQNNSSTVTTNSTVLILGVYTPTTLLLESMPNARTPIKKGAVEEQGALDWDLEGETVATRRTDTNRSDDK